jgi:hypothetical protein
MANKRMMSRAEVLNVLRRTGYPPELVDEIAGVLPDPVDLDRDQHLFERYGLHAGVLMDRMGGSP